MDIKYKPARETGIDNTGWYFNYTQFETLYEKEDYNLSPRFLTTVRGNANYDPNKLWKDGIPNSVYLESASLAFLDLEREAEIGIGTDWQYTDLA